MSKAKYEIKIGGKSYPVPVEKLRKHMSKLSKLKGSTAIEKAAKAAKAAFEKTKDR